MVYSTWDDWLVEQEIEATEPDGLAVWYLGCNGFVLRSPEATVYIDPYFADGDPPSIVRMIPVPMDPADATLCDAVLVTHEHIDHMHLPSYGPLLEAAGGTVHAPGVSYEKPDFEGDLRATRLLPSHWDVWRGVGADPTALHEHAASYAYPRVLEVVTVGDRVERSDGVTPAVTGHSHAVLDGVPEEWPPLLGYNRVVPDDGSDELVRVDEDPLVVVGDHGSGRSAAFTSDCAPHWGSPQFTDWEGYDSFWSGLVDWVAGG